VILGIATDEPSVDHWSFGKQTGMNYPIVMETDDTRRAFPSVNALPTTFVLDTRDGRRRNVGLIDLKIYEDETRALAGLAEANIEEAGDSTPNLPRAPRTDVPGLELAALADDKRKAVLERLNTETCTCGCALTLAQCRINDPTCTVSLPIAEDIVKKAKSGA
jgi:hypothetical protein